MSKKMNKPDHSIRNHVIAIVIATGILALVKPVRHIGELVLRWFWTIILNFDVYIRRPAIIPLWFLYLIVLFLLIELLIELSRVDMRYTEQKGQEKSPITYKSDKFFDVVWRWKLDSNFYPFSITTFCPSCDMQLYPENLGFGRIIFHCDKCNYKGFPLELDEVRLEDWVSREIQRKIRTGEWKQIIEDKR